MTLFELSARLEQFCRDYGIAKKHWDSLRLVSDICFTVGCEPGLGFYKPDEPRKAVAADFGIEEAA